LPPKALPEPLQSPNPNHNPPRRPNRPPAKFLPGGGKNPPPRRHRHDEREAHAMKRALLFVLVLLWPVCASACNACLEDKIAATYDWRVVSQAKERGHTVVFAAIRGAVSPGDSTLARAVQRRLAVVRGVDPGTVRVSLAPPAASFACDGVHAAPRTVIAAANRALASSGHSLALVRVGAP